MEVPDYYEFLQISPSAENDTIHRVYRFLAARFHPDNHDTGDAERFFLLKQAYEVLSESRAPRCIRCDSPSIPAGTPVGVDRFHGQHGG